MFAFRFWESLMVNLVLLCVDPRVNNDFSEVILQNGTFSKESRIVFDGIRFIQ